MMEERKEERKKERTNERKAGQAWVWDGWVGGGGWVPTCSGEGGAPASLSQAQSQPQAAPDSPRGSPSPLHIHRGMMRGPHALGSGGRVGSRPLNI